MCNWASFVLTSKGEYWSDLSESHEDIIVEHRLRADGVRGPNVLRVELVPQPGVAMLDVDHYRYTLDQDVLPAWAEGVEAAEVAERRARAALKRRLGDGVVIEGNLEVMGKATALTSVGGNLSARKGARLPALTSVGGNLSAYEGASLPALTSVGGDLYAYEGASLPALTSVGGYLDAYEGASLPALTSVGGKPWTRAPQKGA